MSRILAAAMDTVVDVATMDTVDIMAVIIVADMAAGGDS
jgi:hypothetical protein